MEKVRGLPRSKCQDCKYAKLVVHLELEPRKPILAGSVEPQVHGSAVGRFFCQKFKQKIDHCVLKCECFIEKKASKLGKKEKNG